MGKPINLDELEARAKAATPGPWLIERRDMGSGEIIHVVYDAHDVTWSGDEVCPNARADARYIVAASPVVVLALLAELRSLRAVRDAAEALAQAEMDARYIRHPSWLTPEERAAPPSTRRRRSRDPQQ